MTFNATPTGGNWENKLIDQIKHVEGFSKRVYGDSLGVPTGSHLAMPYLTAHQPYSPPLLRSAYGPVLLP